MKMKIHFYLYPCIVAPAHIQTQQYTDFLYLFDNMLSSINSLNLPCFIMTDSNINLLDCQTDYRVLEYLNTCLSHGLVNTINHPARIHQIIQPV